MFRILKILRRKIFRAARRLLRLAPTDGEPRHWSSIWAGTFIAMLVANVLCLGGSVMFVMLPAYLEDHGLHRWQIGLADGCFWSVSVFIQPWLGPRIDEDGRKLYLLLGALLMSVTAACYLLFPLHPAIVMLLRAAQGVGFTFYLTASWTWMADHAPPTRFGEFFGLFGMSGLVGGLVGVGLAEYISEQLLHDYIFFLAALMLAVGFAVLLFLPDHPPDTRAAGRIPNMFGLLGAAPMRAAALGSLGFGLAIGPLFAFASAYLHILHIAGVAGLFACVTVASALARIYTGRLMDRYGPAALIGPSLVLLGAGAIGLAALSRVEGQMTLVVLGLAGLACGLGYGAIYPAITAFSLTSLPEQARGRAMSLATASIDLGSTAGATVAGVLAHNLDYPRMFLAMGILVMGTAVAFRSIDTSPVAAGQTLAAIEQAATAVEQAAVDPI